VLKNSSVELPIFGQMPIKKQYPDTEIGEALDDAEFRGGKMKNARMRAFARFRAYIVNKIQLITYLAC
jgi:hypothetical protein